MNPPLLGTVRWIKLPDISLNFHSGFSLGSGIQVRALGNVDFLKSLEVNSMCAGSIYGINSARPLFETKSDS
jgi:hypothetical protein